MAKKKKTAQKKTISAISHKESKRTNIPTAELESAVEDDVRQSIRVQYERRNRDLDPQLVWRGKEEQNENDLSVQAPPLYIQEKVKPKALIDDLRRQSEQRAEAAQAEHQLDLFSDFNGLPENARTADFYQHQGNWTNRMILGDSLQVMASLSEREGLRGKVQCIYIDPPYGIKFNSNFQWSTTSRDVKDGKAQHITREPEQVKAFRDTWRDGIHSYLTYLRDRLTAARDLLTESGSVFVQIGDENVHRVRAVMDEVFGEDNFCSLISYGKTTSATTELLAGTSDYILWYAHSKGLTKYRQPFQEKEIGGEGATKYNSLRFEDGTLRVMTPSEKQDLSSIPNNASVYTSGGLTSQRPPGDFPVQFAGKEFRPGTGYWKTGEIGMQRLKWAGRVHRSGNRLRYIREFKDFVVFPRTNAWLDIGGIQSRADPKVYVVQTARPAIQRCILMTTDPGDIVLDPTCGSGTSAYVAEQWGRRWITIDTSRVALALARARIMGARYPYYLLADSKEGQQKEAEITRELPKDAATYGDIRHGFVYQRVPHITLKSIANNAEIDVIWEQFQEELEPLREALNAELNQAWQEWEIPREADQAWSAKATKLHGQWWKKRIARQQEIDASIAAKADFEYLYDKPYEDKKKVRVAGPFTVESLSPHRVMDVDENDDLIDPRETASSGGDDFAQMVLEHLKTAGVQQAHKDGRLKFTSIEPWPGTILCAEGRYTEAGSDDAEQASEKRAGIFIGPEFGTTGRQHLVHAAREAADAGFDVVIACGFNFDALSSEFDKLGRVPVLKARMNADLHMADALKNTGGGNLFVIFGEPDIEIHPREENRIAVEIHGVDVFHPQTGEVRSNNADGIACWFIDDNYNGESFFVRQAYFLGSGDPYKSLKTSLKAEIDAEAWDTLNSSISREFKKPVSGRIAVKVINHLGDEVMKVFAVE